MILGYARVSTEDQHLDAQLAALEAAGAGRVYAEKISGIRTALVLLVGTATLATFINGGGLGITIITGVNLDLPTVLIAGSLLVALLALVIDWLGRLVEFVARPKGL